ncbi:MAG: ArnT family glycosyltransferase [Chitinophagaceae bacterium]
MSIYKKNLILLIFISLAIRIFIAWHWELNNDECYYWTFALFPDWSHFDSPPMIGWILQLFTNNLRYDSPFFIRSIALLVGVLNTILIFIIGHVVRNEKTGWYGALLYNFSIYGVICLGVCINPEVPQSFFWLLTTLILIHLFRKKNITSIHYLEMLLIGVFIGLSILCKYNSIFLWLGILIYVILFKKYFLSQYCFYMSLFLTLLFVIPIVWWNMENRYIGFSKIENLPSFSETINIWIFFKKIYWQIIYYNPINLFLVLIGFVHFFIKKNFSKSVLNLFLCLSIPIWTIFSILSFFKNISVQWVLVAGLPLLVIAAAYLDDIKQSRSKIILWISGIFIILFFVVAIIIKPYYIISNTKEDIDNPLRLFEFQGWEQLNEKFSILRKKHIEQKTMDSISHILASKWHQAAILDYYIARPNKMGVKTIGFIKTTFKYDQISNKRGGFKIGEDFYFITSTRDFEDPYTLYGNYFKKIVLSDTIPIINHKKNSIEYIIYRLYDLEKLPNL